MRILLICRTTSSLLRPIGPFESTSVCSLLACPICTPSSSSGLFLKYYEKTYQQCMYEFRSANLTISRGACCVVSRGVSLPPPWGCDRLAQRNTLNFTHDSYSFDFRDCSMLRFPKCSSSAYMMKRIRHGSNG